MIITEFLENEISLNKEDAHAEPGRRSVHLNSWSLKVVWYPRTNLIIIY